jgi:hypothetical protein
MKKNIGYTAVMKSNGVARDFYSKERLFEVIEQFFGTEEAINVDGWVDLASLDETYDSDEFTVSLWEE